MQWPLTPENGKIKEGMENLITSMKIEICNKVRMVYTKGKGKKQRVNSDLSKQTSEALQSKVVHKPDGDFQVQSLRSKDMQILIVRGKRMRRSDTNGVVWLSFWMFREFWMSWCRCWCWCGNVRIKQAESLWRSQTTFTYFQCHERLTSMTRGWDISRHLEELTCDSTSTKIELIIPEHQNLNHWGMVTLGDKYDPLAGCLYSILVNYPYSPLANNSMCNKNDLLWPSWSTYR